MGRFEILDHTADIAFRAYGDTIEELYEMAFEAFLTVSSLKNFSPDSKPAVLEINILGDDHEELMVRFLNELIHLIQDDMNLPVSLDYLQLKENSLNLRIVVQSFDEFPEGFVEMKAATYHMLKVEELYGEYSATCIIDI